MDPFDEFEYINFRRVGGDLTETKPDLDTVSRKRCPNGYSALKVLIDRSSLFELHATSVGRSDFLVNGCFFMFLADSYVESFLLESRRFIGNFAVTQFLDAIFGTCYEEGANKNDILFD